LHQEPTLTAKSFATFRKADDMIESVIGIIVIHFNAALADPRRFDRDLNRSQVFGSSRVLG
jgi:hypothetical protein